MQAHAKFLKDCASGNSSGCPEPTIPDATSVGVPQLPPLRAVATAAAHRSEPAAQPEASAAEAAGDQQLAGDQPPGREADADGEEGEGPMFAWEEADPRFDRESRTWRAST